MCVNNDIYYKSTCADIERRSNNPDKKFKSDTSINESEREELIRLREENKLLKMKIIYEKKLQALLLEQEAEARQRQR